MQDTNIGNIFHEGELVAHRRYCADKPLVPISLSGMIRNEISLPLANFLESQPFFFIAPIDVNLRRPDIFAPTGETEGLEAHRLHGDVARENNEVGPGNFAAILLLDRPQQSARLVEVDVVGPAVDGCETLVAVPCTAATVTGAVSACTMPRHANEERPVVTVVRRPPVLRIGHQGSEVFLNSGQVEALKFFCVVEVSPHRAGLERMLVQDFQRKLVRPPVPVRRTTP